MYTLSLVFNKNKDKVLMCDHKKLDALNYIGGKTLDNEDLMVASYRELKEETGIDVKDVDLQFLRYEAVTINNGHGADVWEMYITCGVLNRDLELKPEANDLLWVDIDDYELLLTAYGDGNCLTFLVQAMRLLNIH